MINETTTPHITPNSRPSDRQAIIVTIYGIRSIQFALKIVIISPNLIIGNTAETIMALKVVWGIYEKTGVKTRIEIITIIPVNIPAACVRTFYLKKNY